MAPIGFQVLGQCLDKIGNSTESIGVSARSTSTTALMTVIGQLAHAKLARP
jgi:hypothetical protein